MPELKQGWVPHSQYIGGILLLEKTHCFLHKTCATEISAYPFKLKKKCKCIYEGHDIENYR